jgi:chromate transport protein ChrA
LAGLAWTASKVGALSYGGGFVIIPLMHTDAVQHHHWMTGQQFLDAVTLLSGSLTQPWQAAVLALASVWLLVLRRNTVIALLGAGALGVLAVLTGLPTG